MGDFLNAYPWIAWVTLVVVVAVIIYRTRPIDNGYGKAPFGDDDHDREN